MNKYFLLSCIFSVSLFAKPQGFHVHHGGAKIIDDGRTMTIHSGEKTIIDWGSFSIGSNESVVFNQNSSSSAILNRVIGSGISNIQGALTSNGYIFLINPNGIMVGKDGMIKTNGFIASTLDLSNEQFLQGNLFTFKGKASGEIVNLGKIQALNGDIFLVGASIKNEGALTAPMGTVGVALGTTVRLTPVLGQYLSIEYTVNESSDENGIENSGTIKGVNIELIASQNPYALAIKQSGTIEATSVRSEGGKVFLVAEKGGMDISGAVRAKSGDIHLLGNHVEIQSDTEISAPEGDILISNHGKESTAIVTHSGVQLKGVNVSLKASQRQDFSGEIHGCQSAMLSSSSGFCDLNGKIEIPGGVTHILAKDIHLGPETIIDVSGSQGGTILVGGDYKGENSKIPNAESLIVDKRARLAADGFTSNGGKIIFWSNQKIHFSGEASAQALGNQGDGGFIEVSAKSNDYRFLGHVNTFSKSGKVGTLLLDPVTITIDNFGGVSNPSFPTTPPGTYQPSGITSATLDVGTLSTALGSNNVTIDSTATGSGNGDVVFNQGPTWAANTTLTVNAHRYIWVRSTATISSTNTSSTSGLLFTAQGNGTVTTAGNADGIRVDGIVTTNGGQINFNGTGVATTVSQFSSGIHVQGPGGAITTATGPVTLTGVGNTTPLEGNGIRINGRIEVTGSATAPLTLHGTGASGSTPAGSNGTIIRDGGVVTVAGATNIDITGITNNPDGNNTGFKIFNNSSCTATGSGNITITATTQAGTGSSAANPPPQGVSINNNATLSTTSGKITMNVTNASSVSDCKGIEVIGGNAFIRSTSGNIEMTSDVSGSSQNGVACLINGGQITSGSGNITLNASNTTIGGSNQLGILVSGSGNGINTTTGGQLNITGTGGGNGIGNRGIVVSALGAISSTGNATIDGTAGLGVNDNEGVRVESSGKIESLSNATLTITGTGAGTGGECNGLHVDGSSSEISVVDGNMRLNGLGSPNGSSGADGIFITSAGAVRTAGSGNVTITGIAQSNNGIFHTGVEVSGNGVVSSLAPATGTITLNGTGTTAGPQNQGIYILQEGKVESTSGSIIIEGVSSGTGADNFGLRLTLGAIQTASGPITINASNAGGTTDCYGMRVDGGSTVTSTSGNILIVASTSSPTGSNQEGFFLTDVNSKIENDTGQITIHGTGGGSSGQNRGVAVINSGLVNTTSTGPIQVTGTGGVGASCFGTHVSMSGAIRSINGSVTVNGTGGANPAGAQNSGVVVDGLGSIRTVGGAAGGAVEIKGTGGTGTQENHGVYVDTGGSMTTTDQPYQMTGTSTNGLTSDGVHTTSQTSITTGGSGNIIITGNSSSNGGQCKGVNVVGSTISATGTGNVTITNGPLPQSGGTGSGGEVGVQMQNATTSASGGSVTILGRGGTTANLAGSTGGNHGVYIFGTTQVSAAGPIDISGIGGNSNGSNRGVQLSGSTVTGTSTNTVTITGTGANPATPPSPSTQNTGIYINGGVVRSVGGGFSLNGTGGNSSSGENHGVHLLGEAFIESQATGIAAPLSITGTTNSGNSSHGIFINQSGVKTVSTSLLTLQGTTSSTSSGTEGIFIQNNQTALSASIDVGTGGLSLTGIGGTGTNQSVGYELNSTTVKGTGVMTLKGVSRDTSVAPLAAKIVTANVLQNSLSGANLTLIGEDGEWCDKGAGGSNFQNTGSGQLDIQTTLGALNRGGHISFIGAAFSTVQTTSGQANMTALGTGRNITLGLSGSVTTTGGNSTITAPNNVVLGRVNVSSGAMNVTAAAGAISNGTGTIATPALTGATATLTALAGVGSGTSSSAAAIPTHLVNLGGSITGIGNMVIYELDGVNLNAISIVNGGLDVNAGGLITQSSPLNIAGVNGYAFFTTSRETTIGTARITNSQNSNLGESLIAGDYTFVTSPASTVTLSGNQTIGRHFAITSSSYNPAGFTVLTGGNYTNNTVPVPPSPTNTIDAFGPAPNFDISTASLAATGDITINLRATIQNPTNVQLNPAVTLTNGGNAIAGPIRVTTVDPAFTGTSTDYNLVQTAPLTLNSGQNLTINAARGVNNPNVSNPVNPFPSPFTGSTLNAGDGSNITLTNATNSFGGWISIRDPESASITSNGNIAVQHVNTYGDLALTTTGGSIITGSASQNVRSAGNTIAFSSSRDITLNGVVSNLATTGTSNGTITYTSTGGNINGASQTIANNIALSATSGTIGLLATRVIANAPNVVFSSQGNTFLGIPQTVTIAGDTLLGEIDILLSAAGHLMISSQNIGALNKSGLQSAGAGNGITAVTNNGNVTVNQPVTAIGNGAIALNAVGGFETINQRVSSTGGAITLTGATGITHSLTGDITTNGAGTITVAATSGDLTMVDGTQYQTAGGNITLSSSGNTTLGTVNAGTGDIRSTATSGAITNILAAGTNVTGRRAHLTAANGIGVSAKPINTTLDELQANVTGTGDLYILESDALNLTNWDGAFPGISTANGAAAVTNTTGNQTIATNVSVGGATNTLHLEATAGTLTMNAGTIASTAGGNATLLANANIALSQVNVGAGSVTATATTGAISNNIGSLTPPNLIATTATLTSATGIGSGAPTSVTAISTNLTNLGASATSGPIVIRENDALNLNAINAGNGNVGIDAGGLVQQNGATTLSINGDLLIQTSRDATIGTVAFLNSVPTNLGGSTIAGDWTVTTSPNQSMTLTGSSFVGRNYTFMGTPYNPGVFTITEGGDAIVNGSDPDLVGPVINATGASTDFNLSLTTLGANPTITVNLRGITNTFGMVVLPNAIVVGNNGNSVSGNAVFVTTDPLPGGAVPKDYNLIQTAPITLNAGQTMTVNAARGIANPGVSGPLDSPFTGSTLNGNAGSNVTLNLANNFNGNLVIKDSNITAITGASNLSVGHINTYGELTLISQGGTITTGVIPAQTVRSAGPFINFTASSTITLGNAVQAINTAGNLNGNIFYTSSGGNIVGSGVSSAEGISFDALVGNLGVAPALPLQTIANRIAFNARGNISSQDGAYLSNNNTALTIAGQVSNGFINVMQDGAPTHHLTVDVTTVGAITRSNLVAVGGNITVQNNVAQILVNQNVTATGQNISLLANNALIQQGGGMISTGNAGMITLSAFTGITGIGPNDSILTESLRINGVNGNGGELKITNRLAGPNTLEATAVLVNGTGGASVGRNIYYNQEGGSSINFASVMGDGTATLLAIQDEANMRFSGNVQVGSKYISVANRNVDIENILVSILDDTTIVCDQSSPISSGSGTFSSQGIFVVGTNNLAIYASSGPQAPANAKENPPNQTILGGNLTSLATWDSSGPLGLDSKYDTSYSGGGSVHGPGFGTTYAPGNGVFGSQVVWYKFNPELVSTPPAGISIDFKGVLRLIGINAWVDKRYFMNEWLKGPFCTGRSELFNTTCDKEKIRHCKL